MHWAITLLISLGGLAVCWNILSSRWRAVSGADDPFDRVFHSRLIQLARTFHPILPGYPGYMDLKFSLLRHGLVFFLSAGLLRLLDSRLWETILLWVNLLYAGLTCWIYSARKRELQEIALESTERVRLLIPAQLVRDSFVVVAYSVIAAASLYLLLYLDVPAVSTEPATPKETTQQTAETTAPKLVARGMPANGHIFERIGLKEFAPFSVTAPHGGGVYVVMDPISFIDPENLELYSSTQLGNKVSSSELRFFVRANCTAALDVPLGRYHVYYATGDTWYGEDHLFGPDTQYYKCSEEFAFASDDEGYSGWTLSLTAVTGGNLDADRIDASNFPK